MMKLVLLCWLMVGVQQALTQNTQLWRLVTINSSLFTSTLQEMTLTFDKLRCALMCMSLAWCEAWCHDGALGCQLTNLVVSGSYQSSATTNINNCYIRNSTLPEYAFNAIITTTNLVNTVRVPSNLVDGIYNWNLSSCCYLGYTTYPWYLLDLGRPVSVSAVLMISQPSNFASLYFQQIEVRVGNTMKSGDFSSYTFLGNFTGPGQASQTVILKTSQPITGQYVSIQMMASHYFQICHVEIY